MPIFLKNNVNHWSDDISHNSWREMKQMKISKYRNRPRLEIIFNRGFPWIRTVLWKKIIEKNLDEEVRDGKVLWNGSVKKKNNSTVEHVINAVVNGLLRYWKVFIL